MPGGDARYEKIYLDRTTSIFDREFVVLQIILARTKI